VFILGNDKIDITRIKDIISQLIEIIQLLCKAKKVDTLSILNELTNISEDELEELDICLTHDFISDNKSDSENNSSTQTGSGNINS
jgi:hypothetical protein